VIVSQPPGEYKKRPHIGPLSRDSKRLFTIRSRFDAIPEIALSSVLFLEKKGDWVYNEGEI